jgi:hypothetical protein
MGQASLSQVAGQFWARLPHDSRRILALSPSAEARRRSEPSEPPSSASSGEWTCPIRCSTPPSRTGGRWCGRAAEPRLHAAGTEAGATGPAPQWIPVGQASVLASPAGTEAGATGPAPYRRHSRLSALGSGRSALGRPTDVAGCPRERACEPCRHSNTAIRSRRLGLTRRQSAPGRLAHAKPSGRGDWFGTVERERGRAPAAGDGEGPGHGRARAPTADSETEGGQAAGRQRPRTWVRPAQRAGAGARPRPVTADWAILAMGV